MRLLTTANDTGGLLEHLFRRQSGRVVAHLARVLGPARLDLAEESMQEAMLRALQVWPYQGAPENAAGWLYRAATESVLGLHVEADVLRLAPCIPRRWPRFELEFRDANDTTYAITVENPSSVCRGVRETTLDGVLLPASEIPRVRDGKRHDVRVVLGESAARTP